MTAEDRSELSDLEYQSLARFRYALRRFLHFSDQAARDEDLTPNQHQLLLAVRGWTEATAPSITDVAELLQLRHHSTVELAHRAEAAGLVSFQTDPEDGRRQLLHISPAGAAKLTALSVLHRDELRRFRQQLHDLLDTLDQGEGLLRGDPVRGGPPR